SPWTLYCWIQSVEAPKSQTLVAGIGNTDEEYPRYLAMDAGHVSLWMGKDNTLSGTANTTLAGWRMLAATFDGKAFHLYSEGTQVASGTLALGTVSPVLQMAPPPAIPPTSNVEHFAGKIASLTLL